MCLDGAGGTDPDGHGTLIAGVAAAGTDNGKGVAGVAPDARLVVAKVLGPGGVRPGGGHQPRDPLGRRPRRPGGEHQPGRPRASRCRPAGSPLRDGIEYAWSKGAVPVLAAGNYGGLSSENYGT